MTETHKYDQVISEWEKRRYRPKPGEPALPPQLSELAEKSTEDVMKELNRLPFFMTELDETDGADGENSNLEALRSLVYEGEPHEIATNFKNQGNDCYKARQYKNAVDYYTKGLEIDCGVASINSALYLNRAACQLELKNYRMCIEDCKRVLLIDDKNVKACYRSGRAFFAVNRFEEAKGILEYGLTIDPDNASLREVLGKVLSEQKRIDDAIQKKEREEEKKRLQKVVLENSIKLRKISVIKTPRPAEMLEEAQIRLEDPADYQSQLIFPAMVLYPTKDEFDFIGEIGELTTPLEILEMVLNRPKEWFEKHPDFTVKKLECYMETEGGGLVKVGKKMPVNAALMNEPKAPLFDNALRLYVVPRGEVGEWVGGWNRERALAMRE